MTASDQASLEAGNAAFAFALHAALHQPGHEATFDAALTADRFAAVVASLQSTRVDRGQDRRAVKGGTVPAR